MILVTYDSVSQIQVEFDGKYACETALEKYLAMADGPVSSAQGICVKKSDPEKMGPYLPYECDWVYCEHKLPKRKDKDGTP